MKIRNFRSGLRAQNGRADKTWAQNQKTGSPKWPGRAAQPDANP